MKISNYQKEFKKILEREYSHPQESPIRKTAFDQLMKNGLTSKKWDDLRFTNFSVFNKNIFRVSEIKDTPIKNFDYTDIGINNSHKLFFHNGHYQDDISSLPDEIELLSNFEYCSKNNWEIQQPSNSPFDLLNTAFMDSGMSLIVKKDIKINLPILLIFISSGNDSLMISPRLHIDLNESSSLSLFEYHVGYKDCHFSNISTFFSLKKNSQLNHIRLQMDSEKAINMGNIHAQQEKGSKYNFSHFAMGSSLGSVSINTNLNGKRAECHLNGLTLTNSDQHIGTHILINHNSSDCISTQNFKTILKDHSSGVFNGKVIVQKDAQKTDSNQSNKNLLLSDNAKINSNPQLIIHADNVSCSHGSSTGEIDPEALFYMRSRGLDKKTARSLLINGFASEIFEKINNEYFQKFILQEFNRWMHE